MLRTRTDALDTPSTRLHSDNQILSPCQRANSISCLLCHSVADLKLCKQQPVQLPNHHTIMSLRHALALSLIGVLTLSIQLQTYAISQDQQQHQQNYQQYVAHVEATYYSSHLQLQPQSDVLPRYQTDRHSLLRRLRPQQATQQQQDQAAAAATAALNSADDDDWRINSADSLAEDYSDQSSQGETSHASLDDLDSSRQVEAGASDDDDAESEYATVNAADSDRRRLDRQTAEDDRGSIRNSALASQMMNAPRRVRTTHSGSTSHSNGVSSTSSRRRDASSESFISDGSSNVATGSSSHTGNGNDGIQLMGGNSAPHYACEICRDTPVCRGCRGRRKMPDGSVCKYCLGKTYCYECYRPFTQKSSFWEQSY